ncbi:MAG: hypothetical protein RL033_1007 [Pseudomonadota bacterium]
MQRGQLRSHGLLERLQAPLPSLQKEQDTRQIFGLIRTSASPQSSRHPPAREFHVRGGVPMLPGFDVCPRSLAHAFDPCDARRRWGALE